ncbi:MAG TPA: arsinothricin resistance N-acetyltransferase ArsN1 family A [Verrucomicrobiae bacterium]|jgi:L-amino acid N-acyltransferase YncA|nr:arsinothricin resistance N-acetyltransferase ArsN1 family A [Verrucomicrobiae bacterium]
MRIRRATSADAETICQIYNQGIEDRVATLETVLRTPEERQQWMDSRGSRHPVLVAEREGGVIAWASLNPFNPRPAYDHVADLSIYVERNWRGKGVGGALLSRVIETARELGFHKIVLAALASNRAGEALYAKLGFRRVGVYREQGLLDGRWTDVLLMDRLLDEKPLG